MSYRNRQHNPKISKGNMKTYFCIALAFALSSCGLSTDQNPQTKGCCKQIDDCPGCGIQNPFPFRAVIWNASVGVTPNPRQSVFVSPNTSPVDLNTFQSPSVLCLKIIDFDPIGYNPASWAKAQVAVSQTIQDAATKLVNDLDGQCTQQFGSGWRMASTNDGPNLRGWYALGNIPTGTQFFIIDNPIAQ